MQLFIIIFLYFLTYGFFSRPTYIPPATVQVTSIVSKVDSSFLTIRIYKDKYSISLLNDSLTTSKIVLLDKFISKNSGNIKGDKIYVAGIADAPYRQFKKLKDVLKKHEMYKFRMSVTKTFE